MLHRSVGLEQYNARVVAAASSISYFLTTLASLLYVDKVGRRPLLMAMAGMMAVAFLGVSAGVGFGLQMPENHGPGIAAVVFIWLYFTAFSSGWVSIPWLYPGMLVLEMFLDILFANQTIAEVNSLKFRTKGAALATACGE